MSGGTPVETECKQIDWIYGIHGENTRDPVYCQHQRNYQGWLFTEWFFDSRSYPTTEHVTVPTQIQTYRGFPVWVRWAEIVVSDNVKVVDFDATYIHRVKIEIGENSQIEAIHIPKTVTSLTVKVADGYKGDVVFYMESDNPRFKDSWSQSYYKPHYKKCVFIVPKGSEERYKSIGRFQFARIYTSIEDYYASRSSGNAQGFNNSRSLASVYNTSHDGGNIKNQPEMVEWELLMDDEGVLFPQITFVNYSTETIETMIVRFKGITNQSNIQKNDFSYCNVYDGKRDGNYTTSVMAWDNISPNERMVTKSSTTGNYYYLWRVDKPNSFLGIIIESVSVLTKSGKRITLPNYPKTIYVKRK